MYPLYNITDDDFKALRDIKRKAYEEGVHKGHAAGLEDGIRIGTQRGFQAGYAAAQQQPQAKLEAAYEQGQRDAAKLVPIRKNGVGY